MIIEWYTVIFQIVNFLVLVFLLRYFLYGPIVRMMDEREQKIIEREEKAAALRQEAEEEAESFRRQSEDLRKNEESALEKARLAAEEEKASLLNNARREVEDARKRWTEAFEREKESFTVELRRRIGRQACAVARRCLEDLADLELEKIIRSRFIGKLKELPAAELKKLNEALSASDYKITVTSAFSFPDSELKSLQHTLADAVKAPKDQIKADIRVDQSLVCGLELEAGGYRVAWSVEDYLADVEEQILIGLEQSGTADQNGEVSLSDQS